MGSQPVPRRKISLSSLAEVLLLQTKRRLNMKITQSRELKRLLISVVIMTNSSVRERILQYN